MTSIGREGISWKRENTRQSHQLDWLLYNFVSSRKSWGNNTYFSTIISPVWLLESLRISQMKDIPILNIFSVFLKMEQFFCCFSLLFSTTDTPWNCRLVCLSFETFSSIQFSIRTGKIKEQKRLCFLKISTIVHYYILVVQSILFICVHFILRLPREKKSADTIWYIDIFWRFSNRIKLSCIWPIGGISCTKPSQVAVPPGGKKKTHTASP